MKLFNCVHTINSNTWNYLTERKQMSSGSFKNVSKKQLIYKLYVCIKRFGVE